jgi:hypothetical protein
MGTRIIFILLLLLIVLIGFAPALIGIGGQLIAEAYGCQVDLNRVIPCMIHGRDYKPLFYKLGFAIWYSYLGILVALVLLGLWAVAVVITLIFSLGKTPSSKAKA